MSGPAGWGRLNVLVVEDDPVLRDVYRDLLTDAGHRVQLAADGQEGLERLRDDLDLVLTDLNMPRMSGAAFLTVLRESPHFARIPVLVITAVPRALPEFLQGPWTSVMRKPFRLDLFTRFVENAANHKRSN